MQFSNEQALAVAVLADALLDLGIDLVCLSRCPECGIPQMAESPANALVCGFCGCGPYFPFDMVDPDAPVGLVPTPAAEVELSGEVPSQISLPFGERPAQGPGGAS